MGRPRPLCWARCSLVSCVPQFCNVVATISDGDQHVDLPPPAIMFPVALWTGKQVVSMLLKQNKQTQLLVNVELKERNYSGKNAEGKEWLHMCPDEGYVCIRNRWEARRSRAVFLRPCLTTTPRVRAHRHPQRVVVRQPWQVDAGRQEDRPCVCVDP